MIVSVIIVNWNTRDLLAKCLQSISDEASGIGVDVWVVDNASDDDSAQMVRSKFPHIGLIEADRNLGFAHGNNIAIVRSSGEFLLLLNPDTELDPGAPSQMLDFLEAHPGAGAVGPMLVGANGELQWSASPEPTLVNEFVRMLHLPFGRAYSGYDMDSWDRAQPREVDVLQGACLMLRRSALDEVGLLDEDYFMYSEEVDLCLRLRRCGWTIHWLPTARVVHHGGQSSQQVPLESFLHLYRGKVTYFRKNHGIAAALVYKIMLAVASAARLLLTPLVVFEQAERRRRHLALAGRYRRLLAEMPGL